MPHFYLPGNEAGPAYEFETDPGTPYVLWEDKPKTAKVAEQADVNSPAEEAQP